MRILILNDSIGDIGGAERYVTEICDELAARGWDVHLAWSAKRGESLPRVSLHPLPADLFAFPWRYQPDTSCLDGLLKEIQPDVAFLHNVLNPGAVGRIADAVPSFRFIHDHRLFCPEGKILWRSLMPCERPFGAGCLLQTMWHGCMGRNPRWLWANMRIKPREIAKAKLLKGMLVASPYMKRCLVQQGFVEDRIHVTPLFSRFPVFDGETTLSNQLLYVGQLSKRKGVPTLIESFGAAPGEMRLLLAGEAPTADEESAVADAIRRSPGRDRIERIGWRAGEDLLQVYRSSVALAMPSIWPEPFGLVGAEALSQGTPVVAFNVGGLGEWLQESQAGVLVEPGDWKGFVDAPSALWRDRSMRTAMAQAGRAYVAQRMTLARHVDLLEQILR